MQNYCRATNTCKTESSSFSAHNAIIIFYNKIGGLKCFKKAVFIKIVARFGRLFSAIIFCAYFI